MDGVQSIAHSIPKYNISIHIHTHARAHTRVCATREGAHTNLCMVIVESNSWDKNMMQQDEEHRYS